MLKSMLETMASKIKENTFEGVKLKAEKLEKHFEPK
jgi:hypothetical protein